MNFQESKSHLGHLAVWTHAAKKKPKARVIIVHGMGEHSGRHLNTVNALLAENYEVVRFDLRGCGMSGGDRQYINSFDDYVDDLVKVYTWICEKGDHLPLMVVAHSMGGAIAIRFAARYSPEIEGLFLSAPAFRIGDAVSEVKIAVGKVLARFTPRLRLPKSTDMAAVSRDPKVIEEYANDPLACRFNTLQQGAEILRALDETMNNVEKISCPMVLFHGTSDKIIRCEGSFEILMGLKSCQKKLLYLLPNGYHEPHNDIEKEKYFSLLTHEMNQVVD